MFLDAPWSVGARLRRVFGVVPVDLHVEGPLVVAHGVVAVAFMGKDYGGERRGRALSVRVQQHASMHAECVE